MKVDQAQRLRFPPLTPPLAKRSKIKLNAAHPHSSNEIKHNTAQNIANTSETSKINQAHCVYIPGELARSRARGFFLLKNTEGGGEGSVLFLLHLRLVLLFTVSGSNITDQIYHMHLVNITDGNYLRVTKSLN